MRYVVELTLNGPETKAADQPEPKEPRVETLVIEADNVPQAIEKAKEGFRECKITDVNIRFR